MAGAYETAEIIACVGPWLIAAGVGGVTALMFAGVFWAGMKWRER